MNSKKINVLFVNNIQKIRNKIIKTHNLIKKS